MADSQLPTDEDRELAEPSSHHAFWPGPDEREREREVREESEEVEAAAAQPEQEEWALERPHPEQATPLPIEPWIPEERILGEDMEEVPETEAWDEEQWQAHPIPPA